MKSPFIFLLFFCIGLHAQQLTPKDALWKQIEAKNTALAKAFIAGDTNGLQSQYMQWAVMMPEHSTIRKGETSIKKYYTEWLSQAKMNSYSKTIIEVQDLDGWALEIGTFVQNFTLTGAQPFEYKGKYMVFWRTSAKLETSPFIAAEIWGANDYINDANFPVINDSPAPRWESITNEELKYEVISRNQHIGRLVIERKGAEHAALFMPDAIYMTYYNPMLVGIDSIKPYFTEHEKPGTLKIETLELTTNDLYNTAAGPVIEFGSYKVDWTDGDAKGSVTGKSINVWKRDATGMLMMYRQMVNHD
jgi:ketosteroid isomerase-like protein